MYRPGSGGYGDKYDYDRYEGRYGSRDEDQNGYGRERDYSYRDDDRYSRNGDSYSRDGDRYGRDYEDRHGRDGYRDDSSYGRSRSVDRYQDGSGRDSDRYRSYDDDGQSSRYVSIFFGKLFCNVGENHTALIGFVVKTLGFSLLFELDFW